MEYGLVDYDVQDTRNNMAVYPAVYKHLGPLSLRYTDSVYLINLAHMARVQVAMDGVNRDLAAAGKPVVEFHVTEVSAKSAEAVRGRSLAALTSLIGGIASRLNTSIEKLEAEIATNEATVDINVWTAKRSKRISNAARDLKEARGLALIFQLDQNVLSAVEATDKVIAAQKAAAGILK